MWDFLPYELPIKVDRHAMRICLGSGVVPDTFSIEMNDWENYDSKALTAARILMTKQGHFTEEQFLRGEVYAVRSDKLREPITRAFQKVCQDEKFT